MANVMVVSELERRPEIGLRRALGATGGDVRHQFLAEALLLSGAGGLGGVALGAAITAAYAAGRSWGVAVPVPALAGAMGAALLIGAVAGLYPALRAARLAPTDACGPEIRRSSVAAVRDGRTPVWLSRGRRRRDGKKAQMPLAGVSPRARTLATDLLEQVPSVYCSVMRRRHPEWFLVDGDTDIVIESYQSCGNTFARKAMEHANPQARIASHSHSWANVARGLRLGKPVVVLMRHPIDAVASHAVRMHLDDVDRELHRYHRFFDRVTPVAERVVLAPFDVTVNRFGDVIAEVNRRFSTSFRIYDHTDPEAKAAVFEEMDREAMSSPSELDRVWRVARPNAARAEATKEMKDRLRSELHRPALIRCLAAYDRLLRVGGLS